MSMIYVSCGICLYIYIHQKAACSSCFILAVSGFSVSPPRFHDLITKELREIDFNEATGLTASERGKICAITQEICKLRCFGRFSGTYLKPFFDTHMIFTYIY